MLVSWCFEASQLQRIMSGLKTNLNLSATYSIQKSLKPQLSLSLSLSLKPQLFVKIFHKETFRTQHISYFTEHTDLSRKVNIIPIILKCKLGITMFWSLFILRGHSTWEPALIVCDDNRGDLFYSA